MIGQRKMGQHFSIPQIISNFMIGKFSDLAVFWINFSVPCSKPVHGLYLPGTGKTFRRNYAVTLFKISVKKANIAINITSSGDCSDQGIRFVRLNLRIRNTEFRSFSMRYNEVFTSRSFP